MLCNPVMVSSSQYTLSYNSTIITVLRGRNNSLSHSFHSDTNSTNSIIISRSEKRIRKCVHKNKKHVRIGNHFDDPNL